MMQNHQVETGSYTQRYLSTAQLQKLFDSSLDIICSIDLQGKFKVVSSAALKVWGYHPEELIGKPYMNYVLEEDWSKTERAAAQIMQGTNLIDFQNRYRHKNGSIVYISWSAHWDAQEQIMFCIARDASEKLAREELQAQYERKVKRQHQQMREMLNRLPDGFYGLDEDFNVLYWNNKAEAILGKSKKEAIGNNLWTLFPEAVNTPFYINYHKALKEQRSTHFEAYFEPLSGWFKVSAHPSKEGLSVFFQDITEQKAAQERLRKLQHVAEQTNNIVIITDREGKITWVNESFTEITGYSFEEAYGYKPGHLLQGADTDTAVVSYMSQQIQKEEPFTTEVLNYTKEGWPYWIEVHCQPMYNEDGTFDSFFAIQTDITRRKALEKELQLQQKKIAAATIKAQEKERSMVGQELHDNVNQVLTSVKLYQELCLSGIGDTKELQQKSIDLLQLSINEIRSLSKRLSAPTLGKIKLKDSVKELIDNIAATNRFAVDTDISAIEKVDIDQDMHLAIYRILQEHLTNVLKYAEAAMVHIFSEHERDYFSITVQDDGRGFDPENKRTGIGITNMFTRAESIDGALTIKSTPGNGCTLTLRVPVKGL